MNEDLVGLLYENWIKVSDKVCIGYSNKGLSGEYKADIIKEDSVQSFKVYDLSIDNNRFIILTLVENINIVDVYDTHTGKKLSSLANNKEESIMGFTCGRQGVPSVNILNNITNEYRCVILNNNFEFVETDYTLITNGREEDNIYRFEGILSEIPPKWLEVTMDKCTGEILSQSDMSVYYSSEL